MSEWELVGPILRDQAYDSLDAKPEVLLEQDAGSALPADVYFARLLGLDDEIVQDEWRLPGTAPPPPLLCLPLMRRVTMVDEGWIEPTVLHVAEYRLQSGSAVTPIAAPLVVPGVEPDPKTLVTRVGWLRYRRRA